MAEPRQKHRKLASASAAVGDTRGSQAVVTPAAHRLLRGVKSTPAAPTKGLASENRSATTRPLASVFYPAAAGGVSKRGVPPLKGGADSQPKKGRRKF